MKEGSIKWTSEVTAVASRAAIVAKDEDSLFIYMHWFNLLIDIPFYTTNQVFDIFKQLQVFRIQSYLINVNVVKGMKGFFSIKIITVVFG